MKQPHLFDLPDLVVLKHEHKPEEWREIPFAPGYKVSSHGRCLNMKTGKLLYGTIMPHGYVNFGFMMDKKQKNYMGHQVVARVFLGESDMDCVNHLDGDRSNNRVENLQWASFSQNALHAYKLKRQKEGRITRQKPIKHLIRPLGLLDSPLPPPRWWGSYAVENGLFSA